MAQLSEHSTLDLSLSLNLRGMSSSLVLGSMLGFEPARNSLSVSLSLSFFFPLCPSSLFLNLSKKISFLFECS